VSPYAFPSQPSGVPGNAVNPNVNGSEQINDAIFKLQYTHAMGTNAYARVYAYSLYSDWLNNDPNGSSNPYAFVPSDYILPTHTKGLGLTLADQVGNHLFNLTGGYSTATLSRWNNSFPSTSNPVAVLVNSANPTAGCYAVVGGAGVQAPCSTPIATSLYGPGVAPNPYASAAKYTVPGTNKSTSLGLQPTNPAVTVANAGSYTCGSGPCEFLTVGSGLNGSYNNVTPRFSNLTLADSWTVTPKLSVDLGVRYDSFQYDVPSATSPQGPNPGNASDIGRALFTNSTNQYNCYSPNAAQQFTIATAAGVCPAGSTLVAFSNANATSVWYGGFQPRLGATYKLDALNVLRLGWGKYLQPSSTAYTFYNRAGADVASYDVPKFYPYGFTTAQHSIPPETSFNLDFSWEHQVKGSDLSWKITPFYRKTQNEDINVVLDPTTNFVSAIPALASTIKGVELFLRKGDFSRNGFAGQLSYTYTYEQSKYQTLPGGTTALTNVNNTITQYNAYTSFCASHSSDSRCGTTTNGAKAAPCYTSTGTPDASCGTGSIANPYWNAPVQALFDPNASYYPYNQTFGTGFSSNASSYNIPHVAALILNYKHNKWAFTPTVQFTAGGRYGSPVQGIGIDPAAGCTALPGSTTSDPRYPYGAPAGSPYNASTCAGYFTAPDPVTGVFDTPGQFVEPSQILANLGISYQANKRLTLNVTAVNLYGTCFGGTKTSWTYGNSKTGCWYAAASGVQAGNFYNPGDTFQTQASPYMPVTGGIAGQQVYGTSVNPLQVFFSAQLKM
jgi:TonB dependent receptor